MRRVTKRILVTVGSLALISTGGVITALAASSGQSGGEQYELWKNGHDSPNEPYSVQNTQIEESWAALSTKEQKSLLSYAETHPDTQSGGTGIGSLVGDPDPNATKFPFGINIYENSKANPFYGQPLGWPDCDPSTLTASYAAFITCNCAPKSKDSDHGPGQGDVNSNDHTGKSGAGGGGDDKADIKHSTFVFPMTQSGQHLSGTLLLYGSKSEQTDAIQYLQPQSFTVQLQQQNGNSKWKAIATRGATVTNEGNGIYLITIDVASILDAPSEYRVEVSIPSEHFVIDSTVK